MDFFGASTSRSNSFFAAFPNSLSAISASDFSVMFFGSNFFFGA